MTTENTCERCEESKNPMNPGTHVCKDLNQVIYVECSSCGRRVEAKRSEWDIDIRTVKKFCPLCISEGKNVSY